MEEENPTRDDLEKMPFSTVITMLLQAFDTIKQMSKTIDNLTEQVRIMNQRSYGRKTEAINNSHFKQEALDLGFNEAEAVSDTNEPEPSLGEAAPDEKDGEKGKGKHKQKGDKEAKLKKITNHRDVMVELSEEELNARFGEGKWKKIGEEPIWKLEHHPASFEAVTYHICIYAKNDNQTIVRADKPVEMFQKSICTPSLLASIIFAKYVNAVPLNRQEKVYRDNDVFITRATMANWVIKAADEYLSYLYEAMKAEIMKNSLLHADETPVTVVRDGRAAGAESFMWVYRTNAKLTKKHLVMFQYCKTRGYQNPESFLKDFKGTLVTDAYGAYHKLEKTYPEKFKVAGCWVHAKRKVAEIVKSAKKDPTGSLADTAVKKIQLIYHAEHRIEDLPPEKHLKMRKELVKDLVDDFFTWVKEVRDTTDSQSATGQGFTYVLNQEKYLRAFLDNPDIPLDNNTAERAIRPVTLGRKNWVIIDTIKGADASAMIYSIVETAKANNLRTYDYLNYLLEELPKCMVGTKIEIPDRLLPWSDELPKSIRNALF